MLISLLLWIILTVLIGFWASTLNRSVLGYVILSLFLSPLVSAILLLIVGVDGEGLLKKCPACAESVKVEALLCKHCGTHFPEDYEYEKKEEVNKPSPFLVK